MSLNVTFDIYGIKEKNHILCDLMKKIYVLLFSFSTENTLLIPYINTEKQLKLHLFVASPCKPKPISSLVLVSVIKHHCRSIKSQKWVWSCRLQTPWPEGKRLCKEGRNQRSTQEVHTENERPPDQVGESVDRTNRSLWSSDKKKALSKMKPWKVLFVEDTRNIQKKRCSDRMRVK